MNVKLSTKFDRHASARTNSRNRQRVEYASFALAMHPDWDETYFQTDILAPMMEAIACGDSEFKRVMFTLPFRYSKTEYCFETFIPFYFGHNPDHPVILISYGKAIARRSGRKIRDIMKSPEYAELFPNSVLKTSSRASDEFETVSNGKFFAGGFDTGVNGRGAKLLVIDDPHKNIQEVNSEPVMANIRNVYNTVVRTRCEPDAAVLIGGVRWTPSDMIGWRIHEDGAWDVMRDCEYNDKTILNEGRAVEENV